MDKLYGDRKGHGGRQKESGVRGQRFQTDYGRDNSSKVGSASAERGAMPKDTGLSQSISGASVAKVSGLKGNEGKG